MKKLFSPRVDVYATVQLQHKCFYKKVPFLDKPFLFIHSFVMPNLATA